MENWVNFTSKKAHSDNAEFIFPRKVSGFLKTDCGIVLDLECSSFATKIQKSFGYTFLRFIDKGIADRIKISIEAVGDFGFRIRYSKSGDIDNDTLMAPQVPVGKSIRISEAEECLVISLAKAELRIMKKPFHMSLRDSWGKTLLEIPGIDTAHPNASGAGGFASLKDFFPFGLSDGFSTFTSKLKLNEKIYGLGEKFVGIDRRGQHLESIQQDCAGNEGARTYKNVPFYMSTEGYGVFVNSAFLMDFDIGSNNFDYANVFLENDLMDIFLIAGL